MLKLQEVGAVLVDLRNEALRAQKQDKFFVDGYCVEAAHVLHMSTHCLKHLATGDVKGFVRYLQAQSGPCTDTFDYIVSELFERLSVVGTCENEFGRKLPCWEDFEEQYLTA